MIEVDTPPIRSGRDKKQVRNMLSTPMPTPQGRPRRCRAEEHPFLHLIVAAALNMAW